jgi:hypothetical protein
MSVLCTAECEAFPTVSVSDWRGMLTFSQGARSAAHAMEKTSAVVLAKAEKRTER